MMGRHTLEYILFVKFNTNNIWYSLSAKQATVHHFGSSLCKAQRFTLLSLCWKCFLIKRKKEKNQKPIFSSIFLIIRFVNWSMQYYNWQTRTHSFTLMSANEHIYAYTCTHTHTQTSNWHFLNVNNMSPAPPSLEEMKRERQKDKERKCHGTKWQASIFHNILLYRSICIHLIAFVSVHFQMNPLITLRLWSAARDTQINRNDELSR